MNPNDPSTTPFPPPTPPGGQAPGWAPQPPPPAGQTLVANRPAGDYASGDDTLNLAPSKLVDINEKIAALVPELRLDIPSSFCLRDGTHLTGGPGFPPQVRLAYPPAVRVADLGTAAQGGNDGALYDFLFNHGAGTWAQLPCFLHSYLIGNPVNTKVPFNVRDLLRELEAAKSVADLKAIIHKYNPDQNITDIETRWPWVQAAMAQAWATESAQIQQEFGSID